MDQLDLNGPTAHNWKVYDPPVPPRAGRYTATLPEAIEAEIGEDQIVRATLDPVVLAGVPAGQYDRLRFVRISNKVRVQGRRAGTSQMSDLLMAAGVTDQPEAAEDWKALVESLAGATIELQVDWEAYDKDTDRTVARRYAQFPDDPANPGEKLPYIDDPVSGRRVAARAQVAYFLTRR